MTGFFCGGRRTGNGNGKNNSNGNGKNNSNGNGKNNSNGKGNGNGNGKSKNNSKGKGKSWRVSVCIPTLATIQPSLRWGTRLLCGGEFGYAVDHVGYGVEGSEGFVGDLDGEGLFDFEGDVDLVERVDVELVEGAGECDGVGRDAL